jgi:integrase/recombinase XerD
MREKGLKPTGVNSVARAVNAYLRWSGSPLKIQKLKEPQEIFPTFSAQQVSSIVRWRPKGFYKIRLQLLALILLDTGCRISEALNLRVRDFDMNNLLVLLDGKGRKQRLILFSFELRKRLVRFITDRKRTADDFLLASRNETMLDRHVTLRDLKRMCSKYLGFSPPPRTQHAFRHTFAIGYLRRGGSVFHLQKVLGHSTLEMTRRYANLLTEDLQQMHERVSLLTP